MKRSQNIFLSAYSCLLVTRYGRDYIALPNPSPFTHTLVSNTFQEARARNKTQSPNQKKKEKQKKEEVENRRGNRDGEEGARRKRL